ncbi:hypothetical protein HON22_04980, partial [Candidatus Peregrinibacteria bacterium]|nr:hypothetical protein [Candidatus Peregrinibacteria bacterium]
MLWGGDAYIKNNGIGTLLTIELPTKNNEQNTYKIIEGHRNEITAAIQDFLSNLREEFVSPVRTISDKTKELISDLSQISNEELIKDMTMINEAGLISLFLIDTLFSDHRLNQEVFIEAGEEKRSRHYQRLLCELIADLVYRPGKEEGIDLSEEMLPSQIFNPFMSAFTKISKNKDLKNEKLLTLQIVKILTDTPDYIHERAERGEIEFDSSLLSS